MKRALDRSAGRCVLPRTLLLFFLAAHSGAAASAQEPSRRASATPGSPLAAQADAEPPQAEPVVVASKPFAESYILAEIFAVVLEEAGLPVDRRLGLGATELAFQGLRAGDVDVYPEYTGTGLLAILGEDPGDADADAVFRRVSDAFRARWGVHWLPPLGFENSYAIAVRRATADSLDLHTLSDLSKEAPDLVAGLSPDFVGRSDGLPGLETDYGLAFGDVRSLLQAVKYEALAGRRVDVIDGYTTDGALDRDDLVVLDDDRGFFPPYDAAPLVAPELPSRHPEAVTALARLAGRFDAALMRELNRRREVDREDVGRLARVALARVGLLDPGDTLLASADRGEGTDPGGAARGGGDVTGASRPGVSGTLPYMWDRRGELVDLTGRHLFLSGASLLAAILLAVPLGLLLERWRRSAEGVIRGVGLLQTVPSIALLAFMIPLLGIGVLPAVVALFLYSLFPILRNTFTGVRDADPTAVEAAEALGMTPGQVLAKVRLPLAAPVIMAGVRTAAVINVGTATLAAFIGAGGLGDPIVAGLALSDSRMILSGAIPAALLAFLVDVALGRLEVRVTPRGLEPGSPN